VETAIVVEHLPSGVRGEASERRSQQQNRQQALLRLRIKLALQLRHEPAPQSSVLWRQRARGGRISVSAAHEDFPALLAEALDAIHAGGYLPADAASRLEVSVTQLVKLLKVVPIALANVNRERQSLGQPPLR
jgi:hypothetical protein